MLGPVIKPVDRSRVLIGENDFSIAGQETDVLGKAGALALVPAGTIAEAYVLLHKSKPNVAVLNLALDGGDWPSFMIDLMECRVPVVLYETAPSQPQRLVLRTQILFPSADPQNNFVSAIAPLVRPHWSGLSYAGGQSYCSPAAANKGVDAVRKRPGEQCHTQGVDC
jgi:hypothetical protein